MKEGPVTEVTSTEKRSEMSCSSSIRENEQSDGSPWLLEWFPGFDIPIGLEGRAYLRRLLNHRRAENPAACEDNSHGRTLMPGLLEETLLAAHGIKLGRGVPGHTSNWGSMKVRELLHAAYLLGCWSAVERLCINFCHANGLKTEWIRELKAKGGKQSVTLANLQNYRKRNRERKRPQQSDTKEKKASIAVAVSATGSPCAVAATSSVPNAPVSPPAAGVVLSLCKKAEGDAADDSSTSSVVSEASKKSRRSSGFSTEPRISGPYVCTFVTSQQAALAEPTASPAFEYANLLPQYGPNEAQNSLSTQEALAQESTVNVGSMQLPMQLTLPLLHNSLGAIAGDSFVLSNVADGVANTDAEGCTAARASRDPQQTPSLNCTLENNPTGASSATPCSATPGTRKRRPKRRSGKSKPSGPRKRRQISARKSATDTRTGSFSSVTSCEYPAVHLMKGALPEPAGQNQCVEDKVAVNSDGFQASIPDGLTASTCDTTAASQSLFSTCPVQGNFCRASQRTMRPVVSALPPAARPTARSVSSLPRYPTRQTSPRHCHRWFATSLFSTDSSDNGSSETESLYSRTSTCTTTSSYSDSDHSLHEGCRCSFLKAKQVNFAGKKPSFTCPLAEAPPHSLFLTSLVAEEQASASADATVTPAWTDVDGTTHVSRDGHREDKDLTRSGHHLQSPYRELMTTPPRTAIAVQGSFLNGYEISNQSASDFWDAPPRPPPATPAIQNGQEACTIEAFCEDGRGAVVRAPPLGFSSSQFGASSHESGCKKTNRAQYACIPPAKRKQPCVEWDPPVVHTPTNADCAAEVVTLPSLCRAWEGPPRAVRAVHSQNEAQACFDGARCTHQLQRNDVSRDVQWNTIEHSNRRSSEILAQMGDNAAASEGHFLPSSESQQFNTPQQAAEDKYGNTRSPEGLAGEEQKALLTNGGENVLRDTTNNSSLGCVAQTRSITDKDIRIGRCDATCVQPFVGAPLPSPVPATEPPAHSLFSFNSYVRKSDSQSLPETHALDGASAALNSTEMSYSKTHFPVEDTRVSYFSGGIGDYCSGREDVSTKFLSASSVPSSTRATSTPLLSPREVTLIGASSATAVSEPGTSRDTAEMRSTRDDGVSTSHFPLQLPPLAEADELFSPPNIQGTGDASQMWGKSPTCTPEAVIELALTTVGQRTPAVAAPVENPAASPTGHSNTAVLSRDWGGVQPSAGSCAGDVNFHALAESEGVTHTLETMCQLTCDHPSDLTRMHNSTVQLSVRRSGVQ